MWALLVEVIDATIEAVAASLDVRKMETTLRRETRLRHTQAIEPTA